MPVITKETFYNDVCSIVKEIPSGKVLSYGEIARLIGWPQHSRAEKAVGGRRNYFQ